MSYWIYHPIVTIKEGKLLNRGAPSQNPKGGDGCKKRVGGMFMVSNDQIETVLYNHRVHGVPTDVPGDEGPTRLERIAASAPFHLLRDATLAATIAATALLNAGCSILYAQEESGKAQPAEPAPVVRVEQPAAQPTQEAPPAPAVPSLPPETPDFENRVDSLRAALGLPRMHEDAGSHDYHIGMHQVQARAESAITGRDFKTAFDTLFEFEARGDTLGPYGAAVASFTAQLRTSSTEVIVRDYVRTILEPNREKRVETSDRFAALLQSYAQKESEEFASARKKFETETLPTLHQSLETQIGAITAKRARINELESAGDKVGARALFAAYENEEQAARDEHALAVAGVTAAFRDAEEATRENYSNLRAEAAAKREETFAGFKGEFQQQTEKFFDTIARDARGYLKVVSDNGDNATFYFPDGSTARLRIDNEAVRFHRGGDEFTAPGSKLELIAVSEPVRRNGEFAAEERWYNPVTQANELDRAQRLANLDVGYVLAKVRADELDPAYLGYVVNQTLAKAPDAAWNVKLKYLGPKEDTWDVGALDRFRMTVEPAKLIGQLEASQSGRGYEVAAQVLTGETVALGRQEALALTDKIVVEQSGTSTGGLAGWHRDVYTSERVDQTTVSK